MPASLAFTGGLTEGVAMAISADTMELPITVFDFNGTWDRTANRYTLPANGTVVHVDLGPRGVLATGVTATASWVGIPPPAQSGTLSAESRADGSGTPLFAGLATMTVLPDPALVRLSWNGTTPPTTADYSWDGFLDALLPTDWQQGLQLGVALFASGVEKVQLALDQFVFINAHDAQLAGAGAAGVTQACASSTGTRTVVWNDANLDGALGPGDGFTVTFAGCRIDLPGDLDEVLDGKIVISGYIENASPFSVGGRVDFIGLKQTETGPQALSVSTTASLQLFVTGN
jgi:hypothetical protein